MYHSFSEIKIKEEFPKNENGSLFLRHYRHWLSHPVRSVWFDRKESLGWDYRKRKLILGMDKDGGIRDRRRSPEIARISPQVSERSRNPSFHPAEPVISSFPR